MAEKSFDLTYEGLKSFLRLHLLRRILFWSYLWGIEMKLTASTLDDVLRFDLTYEGLKFIQFIKSFAALI